MKKLKHFSKHYIAKPLGYLIGVSLGFAPYLLGLAYGLLKSVFDKGRRDGYNATGIRSYETLEELGIND